MSSPKPSTDDVLRPFSLLTSAASEARKCVITFNVASAEKFSYSTDFITTVINGSVTISFSGCFFFPLYLRGGLINRKCDNGEGIRPSVLIPQQVTI